MIPQADIIAWSNNVPWKTDAQVEQDLIICRALVEIFSDDFLSNNLAFRGGTALHKLYLNPQPRYSEDIDLVQITSEPFGPIIDKLREKLQFLGTPQRKQKEHNNTLVYKVESESLPIQTLRLKVETNCREHFNVLGLVKVSFSIKNDWFTGACMITTYKLEELLGTKLRALYQRRKGRDLYDLYKAITEIPELNITALLQCYQVYIAFVVDQTPTQKLFLSNMEAKIQDEDFLGDITALIRPTEQYDCLKAYELVKEKIIYHL